jgi:hypothetical protein
MSRIKRIAIIVSLLLVIAVTAVSAASTCPNCWGTNIDGPYLNYSYVNYRDCPFEYPECQVVDINYYHNYYCDDCYYNWGEYFLTLYNYHLVEHV